MSHHLHQQQLLYAGNLLTEFLLFVNFVLKKEKKESGWSKIFQFKGETITIPVKDTRLALSQEISFFLFKCKCWRRRNGPMVWSCNFAG